MYTNRMKSGYNRKWSPLGIRLYNQGWLLELGIPFSRYALTTIGSKVPPSDKLSTLEGDGILKE